MIPDQWYVIANSKNVGRKAPLGVKRLGESLVLWRTPDGQIVCQSDRCAHKGAKLSLGKVDGDRIQCPYHGFRYDAAGECVHMPCLGTAGRRPSLSVKKHVVREAHGQVWLWWGQARQQYPELPITPDMLAVEVYEDTHWERPVHYTRYVESLLEFYHVTHVHSGHWFNYIDYIFLYGSKEKLFLDGRQRWFGSTKCANYECAVDGTTIHSSFDMVNESDPTDKGSHYEITFMFPNLVRVITEEFTASVWLTPIDDENTVVFLRWDEIPALKWLRLPALRRIAPFLSNIMEERIQDRQDVRVMRSQTPKASAPGVSRLVAVDEMNARYLAIRERLIREGRERRPDVVSLVRSSAS